MKTFLQDFHRLINFGELLVELGDILAYHFQWRLNIEVRFFKCSHYRDTLLLAQ